MSEGERNATFKQRLKQLRKQQELTQEQLAEKIHISLHTVQRWESGKSLPAVDILLTLSQFFNVSTDYLTGVSNRKKSSNSKVAVKKKVAETKNTIYYEFDGLDRLLGVNGQTTSGQAIDYNTVVEETPPKKDFK